MMGYLVSSKSRLRLLELLWRDSLSLSANRLAKLAGVSFSTVYAELLKMEDLGIAKSTVVGKARIFSANPEFRHKRLLKELLETEGDKRTKVSLSEVSDREVLLNLAELGAPLGESRKVRMRLSLEQVLAKGLQLSHENPTLARGLPVFLFNRRSDINFPRMLYYAELLGEKQALGFFLELAGVLGGDRKLTRISKSMRDRRIGKVRDFFRGTEGRFTRMLSERNTPSVARKWHYRMNMEMDTFRSLFNKFRNAAG